MISLARHIEGFSRADWDLPEEALTARLGVVPSGQARTPLYNLLAPLLGDADQAEAAAAYGGLWAVLVSSPGGRGRLFGYASRIEAVPGAAALRHDIGDADTLFSHGSMIAFGATVYRLGNASRRQGTVTFMILTGATAGRAAILEGLAVAHGSGVEHSPAAIPILLLRLADSVDETSFAAALDVASHYNKEGWEAGLPEPLLARFRIPVPPPPAPTILQRPLGESWATQPDLLNEPAMAERRMALDAVQRIYGWARNTL